MQKLNFILSACLQNLNDLMQTLKPEEFIYLADIWSYNTTAQHLEVKFEIGILSKKANSEKATCFMAIFSVINNKQLGYKLIIIINELLHH